MFAFLFLAAAMSLEGVASRAASGRKSALELSPSARAVRLGSGNSVMDIARLPASSFLDQTQRHWAKMGSVKTFSQTKEDLWGSAWREAVAYLVADAEEPDFFITNAATHIAHLKGYSMNTKLSAAGGLVWGDVYEFFRILEHLMPALVRGEPCLMVIDGDMAPEEDARAYGYEGSMETIFTRWLKAAMERYANLRAVGFALDKGDWTAAQSAESWGQVDVVKDRMAIVSVPTATVDAIHAAGLWPLAGWESLGAWALMQTQATMVITKGLGCPSTTWTEFVRFCKEKFEVLFTEEQQEKYGIAPFPEIQVETWVSLPAVRFKANAEEDWAQSEDLLESGDLAGAVRHALRDIDEGLRAQFFQPCEAVGDMAGEDGESCHSELREGLNDFVAKFLRPQLPTYSVNSLSADEEETLLVTPKAYSVTAKAWSEL